MWCQEHTKTSGKQKKDDYCYCYVNSAVLDILEFTNNKLREIDIYAYNYFKLQ